MIYCLNCARLQDHPEPWCLACGTILDPAFPERELPPEVAGSLEIERELLRFEVHQSLQDWVATGLFLGCAGLVCLAAWIVSLCFPVFMDSTLGTILLVGTFAPITIPVVALYFLGPHLKARFPPASVRVGLNERGVIVYQFRRSSEERRLKINLAVIEAAQAHEIRGSIFLSARRLGRWEDLMPFQDFGGRLPLAALAMGQIVETLRTAGLAQAESSAEVPSSLPDPSSRPAPALRRPDRRRWRYLASRPDRALRKHWHRPEPASGRSIPIELMGTFTAGHFIGRGLGAGGLVPEPSGLRIAFMMQMHPPIWIPAEHLVSVTRYVFIPFVSRGLCIRHTVPGLPGPIYFSSCRSAEAAMKAVEAYPWAAKRWKKL